MAILKIRQRFANCQQLSLWMKVVGLRLMGLMWLKMLLLMRFVLLARFFFGMVVFVFCVFFVFVFLCFCAFVFFEWCLFFLCLCFFGVCFFLMLFCFWRYFQILIKQLFLDSKTFCGSTRMFLSIWRNCLYWNSLCFGHWKSHWFVFCFLFFVFCFVFVNFFLCFFVFVFFFHFSLPPLITAKKKQWQQCVIQPVLILLREKTMVVSLSWWR